MASWQDGRNILILYLAVIYNSKWGGGEYRRQGWGGVQGLNTKQTQTKRGVEKTWIYEKKGIGDRRVFQGVFVAKYLQKVF